jgi:hypothetical protein
MEPKLKVESATQVVAHALMEGRCEVTESGSMGALKSNIDRMKKPRAAICSFSHLSLYLAGRRWEVRSGRSYSVALGIFKMRPLAYDQGTCFSPLEG